MAQSKIKQPTRHKNNIITPAKREYSFFDLATIKIGKYRGNSPKDVADFLNDVDKTKQHPNLVFETDR